MHISIEKEYIQAMDTRKLIKSERNSANKKNKKMYRKSKAWVDTKFLFKTTSSNKLIRK